MLELAKKAASEAGNKLLSLQGKKHRFKEKKRLGDFATEADLAAEEIILKRLKREFPKHNFISEEMGEIDKGSEYTWIIDPLDGTIAFTAGLDNFGTSIGLLKANTPFLGVTNFPALKQFYWAEKGKGAFLNDKKTSVSKSDRLIDSIVGLDFAYAGGRKKELERLAFPIVDKVRYPPMFACAALGASYVARGVFDGYIHGAHPWDFAAGTVIVEEAGGKVTDYKGKSIDWSKDWINLFASNGLLHDKILSLIKV